MLVQHGGLRKSHFLELVKKAHELKMTETDPRQSDNATQLFKKLTGENLYSAEEEEQRRQQHRQGKIEREKERKRQFDAKQQQFNEEEQRRQQHRQGKIEREKE